MDSFQQTPIHVHAPKEKNPTGTESLMRIAVVALPARVSGMFKIALEEACALRAAGHEARLITQRKGWKRVLKAYASLDCNEPILLSEIPFFSPAPSRSLETL